jgi:DnaJ-class molecular chaperone
MSSECPESGRSLVLIVCRDCAGSGYDYDDHTCDICVGSGETWEYEDEVEEHERKRY